MQRRRPRHSKFSQAFYPIPGYKRAISNKKRVHQSEAPKASLPMQSESPKACPLKRVPQSESPQSKSPKPSTPKWVPQSESPKAVHCFLGNYFRDYYLLLYLDCFQGLLCCFSGTLTVPGLFSGIITLLFRDYYCTRIVFRDYYCTWIVFRDNYYPPSFVWGLLLYSTHFRNYYYPPNLYGDYYCLSFQGLLLL
jgi:hypothetical protein